MKENSGKKPLVWLYGLAALFLAVSFLLGGVSAGLLVSCVYLSAVGILIYLSKKVKEREFKKERESFDKEIGRRTEEITRLKTLAEEAQKKRDLLEKTVADQDAEIEDLKKIKARYQGIIDTEKEIARLQKESEHDIYTKRSVAESELLTVKKKIEELNTQQEKEQELLCALKNQIEGYGAQYIKPSYPLLDELAEGFGYAEAGVKLKAARKNSQTIAKEGAAVNCEYPSDTVAKKVIALVLDAFNSHVEAILAQIKKENYGVLKQKIKDVFVIINNNAKGFHRTSITREYLHARLDELKWGVVAYELKCQVQEEQRRLKEKMRDEERARREYEKALKEAEKEERLIREAMEKARAQAMAASENQKKEYEAKVLELEAKLKEAEARGQKALSMAQQTKRGNVYVISNIGSFGENVYKIGMTRRLDPYERVHELGDASVPFPFDVHAIIPSDDAPALETALHKEFALNQVNKVNTRKEFFKVGLGDIRRVVEKKGLDVVWSMAATAAQYYETLAIEKNLEGNKVEQGNWTRFAEMQRE